MKEFFSTNFGRGVVLVLLGILVYLLSGIPNLSLESMGFVKTCGGAAIVLGLWKAATS